METEVISKGIKIEVAEDASAAFVVVSDPELLPSDVQAALEANGVVFGVDDAAPSDAIKNVGQRVLAASAIKCIDGTNGRLEILSLRERTPAEIKFGITNVYAGETLAFIHNPTAGSPGKDVFGREIKQCPGKPAGLLVGPSVKQTILEDRTKLDAGVDGNLKFGGNTIEIIPEHIIREDIDYSDGELDFAGSLKILGDVKGSCCLNVKHNILIQGSVEDARLIAGGDVTIKGSFVGRGDGLIRAAQNVEVHVVLNQMIEAGGSITVTKECVNAHLIATDSIIARSAIIMGGVVTAGNEIEVRTLGGELYSTTRVKLGIQELLNEDLNAVNKEIELQSKSTADLKSEIYVLVRDRMDGNDFSQEKSERLKFLQAKLRVQNELINKLAEKKDATSREIVRKRSPKLIVLGTIHQSVVVEINRVGFGLKQGYSNVTFEESKDEIIRTRNL